MKNKIDFAECTVDFVRIPIRIRVSSSLATCVVALYVFHFRWQSKCLCHSHLYPLSHLHSALSLSLNSVWTHLMSQWIFCELEYKTVLEQATSVGNTGGNMSHFTPFNFLCLECFYTIFWGSSPFSSLFFTRSNGWYEWRIDVLLKCIK